MVSFNKGKLITPLCSLLIFLITILVSCEKSLESKIHRSPHIREGIQELILAQELVKDYQGNGKCLIIHIPNNELNNDYLKVQLENFKEGLGDKVNEIRTIPIWHTIGGIPKIEDFNKILRSNQDCDLVIIAVPIPWSEEILEIDPFKLIEDTQNPGKWIKDPNIAYPKLGIINGSLKHTDHLLKEELIHTMSIGKPVGDLGLTRTELIKLSDREYFDLVYLIITPKNLSTVLKEYPALMK